MFITRRHCLQTAGAFLTYSFFRPLSLFAEENTIVPEKKSNKTLVAVFLRGGADGLNLVVPFQENNYYAQRKSIAIPPPHKRNGAIDLDGTFGLHPRLKAIFPHFQNNRAVALQAVGHSSNSRSHFKEQDVWETGIIDPSATASGWLNRYLSTSNGNQGIRAIGIGKTLPRLLRGEASAYSIHHLNDLTFLSQSGDSFLLEKLQQVYQETPIASSTEQLVSQTGTVLLEGLKEFQMALKKLPPSSVLYPATEFGTQMENVAQLIRANLGLEVITVDFDGWDTHATQGGVGGTFGDKTQTLGDGLGAFLQDLGDQLENILVLVFSEFGRTLAENGTGGTDHGNGNTLFCLGGTLENRPSTLKTPVLGTWPGLAPENLLDGRDLMANLDFRDVFVEITKKHLGHSNTENLFPEYTPKAFHFLPD